MPRDKFDIINNAIDQAEKDGRDLAGIMAKRSRGITMSNQQEISVHEKIQLATRLANECIKSIMHTRHFVSSELQQALMHAESSVLLLQKQVNEDLHILEEGE